jgi:hypothetical protein
MPAFPARRSGQLLRIERLDGLRAVDDDGVLVVDRFAAERPDEPMRPGIAVAGRVAEREADGWFFAFSAWHG